MNTAERAQAIAAATETCEGTPTLTCDSLQDLVEAELGHRHILDSPQPHGDIKSQALAPQSILHIIAGNTPAAAIQSIIRGLLLGSHNLVKMPTAGLPELNQLVDTLPQHLRKLVELSSQLPDDWLRQSNALIVFGNDETIQTFRHQTRDDQIFIAHGHRVSLGIVFDDDDHSAAERAAKDISLFDQQGCLSPHNIYVHTSDPATAAAFADQLAGEMDRFNQHSPRRTLSPGENAQITNLRGSYDFRQATDPSVKLWTSRDSTAWTVIYEEDPQFATSPLNRVVFVKPLADPNQLPDALLLVRPFLSSIAIHPFSDNHASLVSQLGASRICRLGEAQNPSLFWHQDGLAQLSPLVSWIDFD
jgi:hypothetical protein